MKCHYTPVANEWTYFGTLQFARCWQRLFNGVRVTLRSQAVSDIPRNAGHDLSRPAESAGHTPLRRVHQGKKWRALANSRGVAGTPIRIVTNMQAKALLPERCEQSRVLQLPFGAEVAIGKLTETDETRHSSVYREREGMRVASIPRSRIRRSSLLGNQRVMSRGVPLDFLVEDRRVLRS